jgi:hypothetical protein
MSEHTARKIGSLPRGPVGALAVAKRAQHVLTVGRPPRVGGDAGRTGDSDLRPWLTDDALSGERRRDAGEQADAYGGERRSEPVIQM